jgi:hypothetical protein
VLSAFLQFTDSDHPFGIFKLFLAMYIYEIRRVSYKKNSLLTLREHLSSPAVFCGIHVAHLFVSVLFCDLFVFAMCLVCPMLPVSVDCLLVIAFRFLRLLVTS